MRYKSLDSSLNQKRRKHNSYFIGYGRQFIDAQDIAAVTETLKSDFLTQGPKVEEFEHTLCRMTGAKHCVVVSNGTAALHLAVASLNVPESSEGITSTNTFVASANAFVYCGIEPILTDVDPITHNMSVQDLSRRINSNTKIIIPVHFAGQIADMAKIRNLAQAHGIRIIEDGAHALGSVYPDGTQYGSCTYADLCTFSFHPVKTITTGEGGAITTNDSELYERLLMLRSHGITKDQSRMSRNIGPWYYEMQRIGFNYRMTDIQAALGVSQLKKLATFRSRRRDLWSSYNQAFRDLKWLTCPREERPGSSCFHLYVVQIDFRQLGIDRKTVMEKLAQTGIGTQVHYIPIHEQPYYQKHFSKRDGDFPNAELYYRQALSLPLFPAMTAEDQRRAIRAVRGLER